MRRVDHELTTAHQRVGIAQVVPIMDYIESRFDVTSATTWMSKWWHISFGISAVYLLLIFAGTRWMRHRKPFDLRKPLVLWNIGLAVFSFLGTWALLPSLVQYVQRGCDLVDDLFRVRGRVVAIMKEGIWSSACYTETVHVPRQAVWGYIFGLFKVVELGDTAFIVLRKTPLSFLHWYHHITVFIFTWAALTDPAAVTHWFGVMNFTVHTLMYAYYGIRASGWRLPSKVALTITVLQLSQMFIGIYVNVLAYLQREDDQCEVREDLINAGAVMYASYAILFMNFFYQRYIRKK